MANYQLAIENARVESDGSGDWLSYDLRNNGSNDAGEGTLVAKYEALAGSDSRWSAEEILSALSGGQAQSITQRLGEGLEDGDYVVWVTILDGSDESPAFEHVDTKVQSGRFTAS
jgi:hypothetical protein